MSETDSKRQELIGIEDRIATLTTQLARIEGERDGGLLLVLADTDGAHDRRPTAVR